MTEPAEVSPALDGEQLVGRTGDDGQVTPGLDGCVGTDVAGRAEVHHGSLTQRRAERHSSGSAQMITGVDHPTTGRIVFHGDDGDQEVEKLRGRALRDYRRDVQMVFQDRTRR